MFNRIKELFSATINYVSNLVIRFRNRNCIPEFHQDVARESISIKPGIQNENINEHILRPGNEYKKMELSHPCPNCGCVCYESEIEKIFGYRNMKIKKKNG